MVIETAPKIQKTQNQQSVIGGKMSVPKKKYLVATLIATQSKFFVQTHVPERFPFPLDYRNTLEYMRALTAWNKKRESFFARAIEVINPHVVSMITSPSGLAVELYHPLNMHFELRIQHRPKDKRFIKWLDNPQDVSLDESVDLDFRTVAVISRNRRKANNNLGDRNSDTFMSNVESFIASS